MIGAAFVELYYVFSSLFASRAYYAFGFLALTAGAIAMTTATITILFIYFLLCAEEYRCAGLFVLLLTSTYHMHVGGTGDPFSLEEAALFGSWHMGCTIGDRN